MQTLFTSFTQSNCLSPRRIGFVLGRSRFFRTSIIIFVDNDDDNVADKQSENKKPRNCLDGPSGELFPFALFFRIEHSNVVKKQKVLTCAKTRLGNQPTSQVCICVSRLLFLWVLVSPAQLESMGSKMSTSFGNSRLLSRAGSPCSATRLEAVLCTTVSIQGRISVSVARSLFISPVSVRPRRDLRRHNRHPASLFAVTF